MPFMRRIRRGNFENGAMTEDEFNQAARCTRLHERALSAARAVLVHGQAAREVWEDPRYSMSREAVYRAVRVVRNASEAAGGESLRLVSQETPLPDTLWGELQSFVLALKSCPDSNIRTKELFRVVRAIQVGRANLLRSPS